MYKNHSLQMEWEGKELYIETDRLARRAAGSVVVKYGGTLALIAISVSKDNDFERGSERKIPSSELALVVNNIYPAFSIGRIPPGFIKREGKFNDREILDSRLIDRTIRPLLSSNITNVINITSKLYEHDYQCKPTVPILLGVATALKLIGIPYIGPVVGIDLGLVGDKVTFNKNDSASLLDMFVAYTYENVIMIDGAAKELPRSVIFNAIAQGKKSACSALDFINNFCSSRSTVSHFIIGKDIHLREYPPQVTSNIASYAYAPFCSFYDEHFKEKRARHEAFSNFRAEAVKHLAAENKLEPSEVVFYLAKLQGTVFRQKILEEGIRVDGRKVNEIRDITCEIEGEWLPKLHGSALFQRGHTQALITVTLGSYQDEQIVDDISGERRENFLLHYNFPDYAVGEVGSPRAPGRREIGHGRLAAKSIEAVLPFSKEQFPYTVRVISDTTESDGSSSMAAVCGTSLALMDTGVPIKSHVGGIAMGLIKEGDRYVILSDISGEEDHFGDMDFKVAATLQGITAIQLDIKIDGLTLEIVENTLEQATVGIQYILSKMNSTISEPRASLRESAPKIKYFKIPKEQANKVIGAGGKNIKNISAVSSTKVEVENYAEDSKECGVYITGKTDEAVEKAREMIECSVAVPELKKVYDGTVVKIADFGIFVRFLGNFEGLVHKSVIKGIGNFIPDDFKNYVHVGQKLKVMVIEISENDGKIRLSMANINQDTGQVEEGAINTTEENGENYKATGEVKSSNRSFNKRRDNRSNHRPNLETQQEGQGKKPEALNKTNKHSKLENGENEADQLKNSRNKRARFI